MALPEDRRRRRSEDPMIALHYQLTQARDDGRLDAIVVADESGVVVGGAGAWPVCEELAAYAPLLAQPAESESAYDQDSRMAELRMEVDVQPVDIAGQSVLVCARGGWMRAMAMKTAAEGVARILSSR